MVSFAAELDRVLPPELPHRTRVIELGSRHLELIVETNRQFNLTRITGEYEAAVKHVLDSLLPWRFFEGAEHVLDAGTGAGFPGIPLALALPEVRWTLAESTGKKARFLEQAVDALGLSNVSIQAVRAEDVLKRGSVPLITARAVAPLARAIELFGPALRGGSRALLYKGANAAEELREAAPERRGLRGAIVFGYELPDGLGARALVELQRA